jgi:formylglycine-generating enzyme required for sulfatase activity
MSFMWEILRVYRGGGWGGVPFYARVAFRDYGTPVSRYYVLGVRLMRRCL